MKRRKILLSSLTLLPTVGAVTPLVMLTSCGNKVDLHVNKGQHIKNYEVKEVSEINHTIMIQFEFQDGYQRFDTKNANITVGGRKLSETDYSLSNQTGLLIINDSAVTNTNVEINIDSKASMVGMSIEYESSDGFVALHNKTFLKGCVGKPFTPDNLVVNIQLGDGTFETAEPGDGFNKYKITKNGSDITADFISGNVIFTEEMIIVEEGQTEPAPLGLIFNISYIEDTGKEEGQSLSWLYCGHAPTDGATLTIAVEKDTISFNEKLELDTTTTIQKQYADCKFEIETGAEAEGAIYLNDEDKYVLQAGTKPGKLVLRAVSIFDSQIFVRKTITIQE